jgi:hypothetical protein
VRIFVGGRLALKDDVSNSRKNVWKYRIALNNEIEKMWRGAVVVLRSRLRKD